MKAVTILRNLLRAHEHADDANKHDAMAEVAAFVGERALALQYETGVPIASWLRAVELTGASDDDGRYRVLLGQAKERKRAVKDSKAETLATALAETAVASPGRWELDARRLLDVASLAKPSDTIGIVTDMGAICLRAERLAALKRAVGDDWRLTATVQESKVAYETTKSKQARRGWGHNKPAPVFDTEDRLSLTVAWQRPNGTRGFLRFWNDSRLGSPDVVVGLRATEAAAE